jgi:hypothetical protein
MARPALSRRVEKAVAYPPLCDMSDLSAGSSTRRYSNADSFEDLTGEVADGDPGPQPGALACYVAARQLLASGGPRSLYIWRVLKKSGPGSVGTSSSGRSRSRTS